LNYLILNAGTVHDHNAGPGSGEWITATGHNRVFAANHLGHFLLAALLAPSLKQGGTIVVVSSITAWWGNPAALLEARTNPWKTPTEREAAKPYHTSKLANLCFARSLRRKLDAKGVAVVAMTPGEVATDMHKNKKKRPGVSEELGGDKLFESCFVTRPVPDFVYPYWFPAAVFGRSTSQEESEQRHRNMAYFHRPERLQTLDYSLHASVGPECDLALQEELWKWSREAVNLQAEYDTATPWLRTPLKLKPEPQAKAKPEQKPQPKPKAEAKPKAKPEQKPQPKPKAKAKAKAKGKG
jgi:NAD(P)-dependent dehydrogenase (short-subunit alcohol dehydrogenase family)